MKKKNIIILIGVLLVGVLLVVFILNNLKKNNSTKNNDDVTNNGVSIKYIENKLNEDEDFCDEDGNTYYITFEGYVNGKRVEFNDNYILACEKTKNEVNTDNLVTVSKINSDKEYYILNIIDVGFNSGNTTRAVVVNDKGSVLFIPEIDTNKITLSKDIYYKYPFNDNNYLIKDDKLCYIESDHCTYTNIVIVDFKNDKVTKEIIKLTSSDYTSAGEWC